jgi:hypothetical protein
VIHLRELYPQVIGSRSDLPVGQARWALVEASIRLAKDTFLLKEKTFTTLIQGSPRCEIPIPPGRTLLRVEKVEYRDPTDPNAEWVRVDKTARVFFDGLRNAIDSSSYDSAPTEWSQSNEEDKYVYFRYPSDGDYPLRISYAWAPARYPEPIDLPFPEEAEDALISYAESRIFRLFGKGMNIQASELCLTAYKNKIPGLKSMADTGPSGGSRSIFDFLPME